jgi:hypothetical protein|uniref:Uncharacterized protein n=1 Tax=Alcanivorax borkumensis (strain ATCC 700651 / DSM 11573 / NCIMB 13689 / SK2) TaxID=393595 RepID=Q0VS27_ALCBS|nr:hypothetical protein predicted by Glimmer/Critica [Alcanivorax borkumensis SK2]
MQRIGRCDQVALKAADDPAAVIGAPGGSVAGCYCGLGALQE